MDLDIIIQKIDSLSPVSATGQKVMEIISNPNCSLEDIVDIVKYDQGLTANLLKLCNSAYFGLRTKIVSVKQAVAYLGLNQVADVVMMASLSKNFTAAQKGYDLDEGELWKYSVSSALIAKSLAEKRNMANIPCLFTSALLKDIGKVILSAHINDAFQQIILRVQKEKLTFLEAERKILGIDHAELGAMVAQKWRFSPEMVFIIRNHHDPLKILIGDDISIPIIYLADTVCMMVGIGGGADGLAYRYYQEVMDRLDFSEVDLQKTIADFWEKNKAVEEMINMSGGH